MSDHPDVSPVPTESPKHSWRSADMASAQSVSDVIELRKQETRRRVTYGVVGVFCATACYLVVWSDLSELRMAAFSGLLGIAGGIIGFYYGANQPH